MDLDCMEVEFTYGVRMGLKTAKEVGALAGEKGILLPDRVRHRLCGSDEPTTKSITN